MVQKILYINIISAEGLEMVNSTDKYKMCVYTIVSLQGSKPKQKTKTHVDKDCGNDPTWNFPLKFTLDEFFARSNHLDLEFKIKCKRFLCDKELGQVKVPVKELLDSPGAGGSMKFVSYQVRKQSGKLEGTLNFSYKFEHKVPKPVKPEKINGDPPVTAYPAAHMAVEFSSAPFGAPPVPYAPPHSAGYGYPPHPVAVAYGGYPLQGAPPPVSYLPTPPGCGYPLPGGYGYPPTMQQPPKKNNKFGLGEGMVGAIGVRLIGDMVSDAVAYVVESGAGVFDDNGGFDF